MLTVQTVAFQMPISFYNFLNLKKKPCDNTPTWEENPKKLNDASRLVIKTAFEEAL